MPPHLSRSGEKNRPASLAKADHGAVSLDGLYRETGAGRGDVEAASWSMSFRPRLFMERLPVFVTNEMSGRIEFLNPGSCRAKSAKLCIAKVFTTRLWS